MSNKLSHITLHCHECDNQGEIDYESLVRKWKNDYKLDATNINTILGRFKCRDCLKRNFILLDAKDEVLFDMERNTPCRSCVLAIPFHRLKAKPDTKLCVSCKHSGGDYAVEVERWRDRSKDEFVGKESPNDSYYDGFTGNE